jgi:hypothetical protein
MQLGISVRRKAAPRDAGITFFRFTELRKCEERVQKSGHANHSVPQNPILTISVLVQGRDPWLGKQQPSAPRFVWTYISEASVN